MWSYIKYLFVKPKTIDQLLDCEKNDLTPESKPQKRDVKAYDTIFDERYMEPFKYDLLDDVINRNEGQTVLILGSVGFGKTVMAKAVLKYLCKTLRLNPEEDIIVFKGTAEKEYGELNTVILQKDLGWETEFEAIFNEPAPDPKIVVIDDPTGVMNKLRGDYALTTAITTTRHTKTWLIINIHSPTVLHRIQREQIYMLIVVAPLDRISCGYIYQTVTGNVPTTKYANRMNKFIRSYVINDKETGFHQALIFVKGYDHSFYTNNTEKKRKRKGKNINKKKKRRKTK